MKLLNKKGLNMAVIVSIIVVLLSVFFLSAVYSQATKQLDLGLEGMKCRVLIETKASVRDFTPGDYLSLQESCPVITKDLPLNARTRDALKGELEQHLVQAWAITGNGEIKNLWNEAGLFGSMFKQNNCMILYKINFEESNNFPKDYSIGKNELIGSFLNDHFKELDGRDYTYGEYVQSFRGASGKFFFFPDKKECQTDDCVADKTQEFQPNKVYAISVMSPEAGWFGDLSKYTNVLVLSSYEYAKRDMRCVEFVE